MPCYAKMAKSQKPRWGAGGKASSKIIECTIDYIKIETTFYLCLYKILMGMCVLVSSVMFDSLRPNGL